jgi:hypothetical protein
MSLEAHYVGVTHSLPTGSIDAIEMFDAPTPLTINGTQFFDSVVAVFSQGGAVANLLYNEATTPDLAHFGADLRMRDLLTCAYSLGASQIQIDAPLGPSVSWSNNGEAGSDTPRDRVTLSRTSIAVFATFAALTLIACALLFAYSSTQITPNPIDFAELDMLTRSSHFHLFDGLSNADNDALVARMGQQYIWLGESDDGRSIEMSTEQRKPLELHKTYV